MYCIARDSDTNQSPVFAYDVLRLATADAGSQPALTGTFSCHSGL